MTSIDWPEIFPTLNQPDHEKHLDWTYECGVNGCNWRTYHRSKAGAEAERGRHHENETCPFVEPRKTLTEEGGLMPAGPSIIERLWIELDQCTKFLIENKKDYEDKWGPMGPDERDGYVRLQGQAQGLAIALQMMSVPHFADTRAISVWAAKRYKMNTGQIDFEDTPGCQGYNPMPPSTREIAKAKELAKAKRTGPTGVVSSSPKDSPKTGKFKALTEAQLQTIKDMHGKFPEKVILNLTKISKEQYDYEVSKL